MKHWMLAAAVLVTAAAFTIAYGGRAQPLAAPSTPIEAAGQPDADREAIMKSAHAFAESFNKGDARTIAAMWTENGESRDPDGKTFIGRAAIEKAYTDFFKANPGTKIEMLVKSIRFPAKDMAVEEGLIRASHGPKSLPATTAYVAIHLREGGQWKIALSSEGGVGLDRLEDLDWLLGEWTGKAKDESVKLSFARDPKKPVITGTFTHTPAGKESVSSTIRISLDPETGQIRSWGFEDDGAHSQSLWVCDGKSWILDTRGVLADGTPTAERIVIQRVGPDVITWRAIDRVLGDTLIADTSPMRLTRTR